MKKPGESKRIGVAGFMFGSRSRGVNRIFERLGLFLFGLFPFDLFLGAKRSDEWKNKSDGKFEIRNFSKKVF